MEPGSEEACGARNGNRTRKDLSIRRILSPLRLPISPSGRPPHWPCGRIIDGAKRKFSRGVRRLGMGGTRRDRNRAPLTSRQADDRHPIAPCARPCKTRARSVQQKKREAQRLPLLQTGAGDESRTRDLNLGKVALYQLSYSRTSFQSLHQQKVPHAGEARKLEARPGVEPGSTDLQSGA